LFRSRWPPIIATAGSEVGVDAWIDAPPDDVTRRRGEESRLDESAPDGFQGDAMLAEELGLARDLALRTGVLLLENLGHVGGVDRKCGTELVTDVDRRAEEAIVAGLARACPDDAIQAEESGESGGRSGRTWYVDPLDGTTNYVHGHPFFAVSIALADGEGLRLGVVHAPYLDQLFLAARGQGARLERPEHAEIRALPRRGPVTIRDSLLGTGFPYQRDEVVDRNVEYVRRFLRAGCHGVRRAGSAAIDLAHTAAGVLDGFWELRLRPWDVAAGTLIAREAGCTVSDLAGLARDLQWEEVLAAPPDLHVAMRGIIAGEPDAEGGPS